MAKKTFGLIGAGILVGGAFLAVLFSFVFSDSSSAEFMALSDEAMANLVGGTPQKWNGGGPYFGYGDFADCTGETPPCEPTQENAEEYHPQWYPCEDCSSGQQEYYAFQIYLLIKSWCQQTGPSSCEYRSNSSNGMSDCQFQKGTTC